MNLADEIQFEFPPGVLMPDQLRKLCDFLDDTGYPISGCMRLRPEGEALKAWFGAGSEAWNALAGFGSGPDGSTIAYWMYGDHDISNAPVVHLGSEGSEIKVIANDFGDFLRLFAIGYDELGFNDLGKPPAAPESAALLRFWLKSEFGIASPPTGIDIASRAKMRHPDFESWVVDAQDLRDRAVASG